MINKLLNKIGFQLVKKPGSDFTQELNLDNSIKQPTLIETDDIGNLYQCAFGMKLYLDTVSYLDAMILQHNIWEKDSVDIVQLLVKEGDVVLDVGANFG